MEACPSARRFWIKSAGRAVLIIDEAHPSVPDDSAYIGNVVKRFGNQCDSGAFDGHEMITDLGW